MCVCVCTRARKQESFFLSPLQIKTLESRNPFCVLHPVTHSRLRLTVVYSRTIARFPRFASGGSQAIHQGSIKSATTTQSREGYEPLLPPPLILYLYSSVDSFHAQIREVHEPFFHPNRFSTCILWLIHFTLKFFCFLLIPFCFFLFPPAITADFGYYLPIEKCCKI